MGKLGKKARKFASKNLPSVLKNRRKFRSRLNSFKRRTSATAPLVDKKDDAMLSGKSSVGQSMKRNASVNGVSGFNLFDPVLSEDEYGTGNLSDSDGYLSEDPDCPYISETDEEDADSMELNNPILLELFKQKEKLEMLKKKDPNFVEFLENHKDAIKTLNHEETYSDDDNLSKKNQEVSDGLWSQEKKLSSLTVDVWCWLILEEQDTIALSSLLNGYRAACHYCTDDADESSYSKISNREVFSRILMSVLSEADGIFRRVLGIPDTCSKENFLKVTNNSQWLTVRPLIKSYLRSTLFLLNQVTDVRTIAFTLSQLKASITFFAAFPSLVGRLVQILVHLWVTGDEILSLSSFIVIREMCLHLSSEFYETFLTRTYQAYLGCCNSVQPENMKHIEFLQNSLVDLYSLDIKCSYAKVLACLQQLLTILQQSFKVNNEEVLGMICSWRYVKSVELWAQYISQNISNNDLEPLLYLVIQIVRAVSSQFPGPRYIPLRLRYIQLLNQLSSSSGVFIPITYLLLDIFDPKGSIKVGSRKEKAIGLATTLKAPKQWIKSANFQEECVARAIELLYEHFSLWSCHVSFPDLATIPLILLKRFHDNVETESVRRSLKRFIDLVEANSEFVQRKRDDASFSPSDQASADAFLLMVKASGDAPFTVHRRSVSSSKR